MPKPDRPKRIEIPTDDPELNVVVCDDGSRTLKCTKRDITWHSESGALSESKLVFVENGGIADLLENQKSTPVRVLEVGFGTGLNFLLAASEAIHRSARLDYVAFEPNLLPREVFEALDYRSIEECQPSYDLFFPFKTNSEFKGVKLNVLEQTIQTMEFESFSNAFNTIFHDAFSPESAPDLWEESLFRNLISVLKPGGKLVTYCVKSEIQRRLRNAGFTVSKTRGPVGGKREVLIATK